MSNATNEGGVSIDTATHVADSIDIVKELTHP